MSGPAKDHSPGFLALVGEAKKQITEIDVAEYKRLRERSEAGQLVDVREDHEWEANHAKEAVHLSKGVIERDVETAFPDKKYEAGTLLWRRFPVGAGNGQFAEDGIPQRDLARWRLACDRGFGTTARASALTRCRVPAA